MCVFQKNAQACWSRSGSTAWRVHRTFAWASVHRIPQSHSLCNHGDFDCVSCMADGKFASSQFYNHLHVRRWIWLEYHTKHSWVQSDCFAYRYRVVKHSQNSKNWKIISSLLIRCFYRAAYRWGGLCLATCLQTCTVSSFCIRELWTIPCTSLQNRCCKITFCAQVIVD